MNYKKYLLSVLLLFAIGIKISAQEYCMQSPVGFGRNATGGTGGKVVKVTTRTELSTALKTSGAAIIIIANDIVLGQGEMINEVISNKTILGLPGVKLVSTYREANGGILGFKAGSNNIIVRNIIFEGPGAYDVDGNDLLQNKGCNNLWVDHCEFYDGVDGNFDNTKSSDNISISWCKFGYKILPKAGGSGGSNQHCFSNLVGGSSSDYPSDGYYSITFQYCYWSDGCIQRMPRARNAELHLLNCFYDVTSKNYSGGSTSTLAIGLGAGSNGTTCYVEGTYFKKISTVLDASYDKVAGKSVATNFVNCLRGGSNSGTVSKPSYPYTALDVDNVEAAILNTYGAGATLRVSDTGEVSIGKEGEKEEPLTVPSNVNATSKQNSILVTWDAVSNATSYIVKLSTNNSLETSKIWDFSTWNINASSADANLVLDGTNPRFNYKNATSSEELTFADGKKIPDTEGLKFTAGADTKLRLGFGTGILYLNGTNISIEIPCAKDDGVIVRAQSGNVDATDRGFGVTGANVNTSETSENITGGILKEAGGTGTWAYIATNNNVAIKTVTGGMNVLKITVNSKSNAEEYIVTDGTSKNIPNLQPNTEYTYQVMAMNANSQSVYSQAKTISTNAPSGFKSFSAEAWNIFQQGDDLVVTGLDVVAIDVRNIHGTYSISSRNENRINISHLYKGVYIVTVKTLEGMLLNRKIMKM